MDILIFLLFLFLAFGCCDLICLRLQLLLLHFENPLHSIMDRRSFFQTWNELLILAPIQCWSSHSEDFIFSSLPLTLQLLLCSQLVGEEASC